MADYRTYYDRDYIGAFDLLGKDVSKTIARVECKVLENAQGKSKKLIVYFNGADKGFACCKTNAKTIAVMYGNDTDKWVGKRITLYPTTTNAFGANVECIRVRPNPPKGSD
jgi:hypothetical protein